MPSPLLAFVLTAMTSLAPGRDHFDLAQAITSEVEAGAPLFDRDEDRTRTASLVVAVAFRESTFRNDAIGDNNRSVCSMQIFGGSRDLLTDPAKCIRTGLAMLRTSVRIDRLNPIAFYARGPRFTSETAKRISRDRMALADRVRTATLRVLTAIAEVPSTSFFSPIDATSIHAKGLHAGSFRTVGG